MGGIAKPFLAKCSVLTAELVAIREAVVFCLQAECFLRRYS